MGWPRRRVVRPKKKKRIVVNIAAVNWVLSFTGWNHVSGLCYSWLMLGNALYGV